jgi:predicted tellurium resistance membrane protein TerC
VSRLYQARVRTSDVVLLVVAALFAMLMMVAAAQPLHVFLRAMWFTLTETWHTIVGVVTVNAP